MASVMRINIRNVINRQFSSALYITGDKATNNFVVLTPCIDFEEQVKQKSVLINSIKARKLDIDFSKIEERWNFYKMIDDHKNVLEVTRNEIFSLINKLKEEDAEKHKDEIEKLLLHVKFVRGDLKNIKEYSYGVEENANLGVLSLPNLLHSKTPINEEVVIHRFLKPSPKITESHMSIGKTNDLIEYTDPSFYFLKTDAALFEFAINNYFQKHLLDMGLLQFSNADFATTVVVEGCGIDYLDNSKVFTLAGATEELNRLHIVGGGSLYSFMAYFSKHSIQPAVLPLKFFSLGRKYSPAEGSDLFNLCQNSVAHVFAATEDDAGKMNEIYDFLTQELIKLYEGLGFHFQVVLVPAHGLHKGESLRTSFQMFSNYSQKYVEVGNLSIYDDYLSKRLLFAYVVKKERKFLKVISGEVLNIQKFLACAIENKYSCNEPLLTDVLKKYVHS